MDKSKKHIEARIQLAKNVQTNISRIMAELTVMVNQPIVSRRTAEGFGEAMQRLTFANNHVFDNVFESLEVFVDRKYRVLDVWMQSAGIPDTFTCTGYDPKLEALTLSHGVSCHPEEFKKHLLNGAIEFLD